MTTTSSCKNTSGRSAGRQEASAAPSVSGGAQSQEDASTEEHGARRRRRPKAFARMCNYTKTSGQADLPHPAGDRGEGLTRATSEGGAVELQRAHIAGRPSRAARRGPGSTAGHPGRERMAGKRRSRGRASREETRATTARTSGGWKRSSATQQARMAPGGGAQQTAEGLTTAEGSRQAQPRGLHGQNGRGRRAPGSQRRGDAQDEDAPPPRRDRPRAAGRVAEQGQHARAAEEQRRGRARQGRRRARGGRRGGVGGSSGGFGFLGEEPEVLPAASVRRGAASSGGGGSC
nr:uncharacterized protein LOC127346873 [Lolium perenne]